MRIGGKDVEGAFVVSGPAVIPEQLPANHPSKALAADFVAKYEKAYGANNRNQFAAHAYDAVVVLEKVIPVALKAGKPGTPEFREAIRNATQSMGRMVVSHGVLAYTKANHWGFTTETGVILKVVNGDWKIEQ
jgi:branched-chain amino acid transport system substrate-binding protein